MLFEIDKIVIDCIVYKRILDLFSGNGLTETKQLSEIIINQVFSGGKRCRMLKSRISIHLNRRRLVLDMRLTTNLLQSVHIIIDWH